MKKNFSGVRRKKLTLKLGNLGEMFWGCKTGPLAKQEESLKTQLLILIIPIEIYS